MARTKNPDAPADSDVLVPSSSAFDFLAGSFARSERARLTGLVTIGVAAVALAGSLLVGMLSSVETDSQERLLVQSQSELAIASAELGSLDAAEGIPTAQIQGHISTRLGALRQAVGTEYDTVALSRDLWASAPPGVSITSMQVAEPEGGGAPTVSVDARAAGFTLISQWSQALSAMAGLSDVDVSWTGGGEDVTVTVTATLNDAALSARAQSVTGTPGAAPEATGAPTPDQEAQN